MKPWCVLTDMLKAKTSISSVQNSSKLKNIAVDFML